MFVLHRGQDAHLIEPCGNPSDGNAVLIHGKDHLHIFADCFIHNELILVLRRFPVPVGSERADELSALLLDFQTASDFHGYVLAVRIVNQVLERDHKGVGLWIAGQTVIGVVDGNEANAELREDFLKIPPSVNVVSGKTAEILDHNAVNRSLAQRVLKLPEIRTIEGNPAVPVIYERVAYEFQIVMLGNVVLADCPLAGYGIAFDFVSVLTGQSAVDRRSVNLVWHKNNLRVSVWCDTSNQKDEG